MASVPLLERKLTHSAIGAFFEVYNTLEFGFLEHVYSVALERELRARGHEAAREVLVPVYYKGEQIALQRLDMVVDRRLIIEIKASEHLPAVALRQIQSYLHSTLLEVGLLFHFGPKPTFRRFIGTQRY